MTKSSWIVFSLVFLTVVVGGISLLSQSNTSSKPLQTKIPVDGTAFSIEEVGKRLEHAPMPLGPTFNLSFVVQDRISQRRISDAVITILDAPASQDSLIQVGDYGVTNEDGLFYFETPGMTPYGVYPHDAPFKVRIEANGYQTLEMDYRTMPWDAGCQKCKERCWFFYDVRLLPIDKAFSFGNSAPDPPGEAGNHGWEFKWEMKEGKVMDCGPYNTFGPPDPPEGGWPPEALCAPVGGCTAYINGVPAAELTIDESFTVTESLQADFGAELRLGLEGFGFQMGGRSSAENTMVKEVHAQTVLGREHMPGCSGELCLVRKKARFFFEQFARRKWKDESGRWQYSAWGPTGIVEEKWVTVGVCPDTTGLTCN